MAITWQIKHYGRIAYQGFNSHHKASALVHVTQRSSNVYLRFEQCTGFCPTFVPAGTVIRLGWSKEAHNPFKPALVLSVHGARVTKLSQRQGQKAKLTWFTTTRYRNLGVVSKPSLNGSHLDCSLPRLEVRQIGGGFENRAVGKSKPQDAKDPAHPEMLFLGPGGHTTFGGRFPGYHQ